MIRLPTCLGAAAAGLFLISQPPASPQATARLGLFDSRAVAVAWGNSDLHDAEMRELHQRHEKARAEGDETTVQALEAEAQARQQRLHLQGFAAQPIPDILEHLQDQLPELAEQAGVDVIVSRWDVVYQAPSARVVDVTDVLVEAFGPDDKVREWVRQLRETEPVPPEDLEQHDH